MTPAGVPLLLAALLPWTPARASPPRPEEPSVMVHIPSTAGRRARTMVVVLSPGGDARGSIETWKAVSEKRGWVILASKEFRNGPDMEPVLLRLGGEVERTLARLRVDPSRVVAAGISGGGMAAYALAAMHPKVFSAVVVNTGMMRDAEKGMGPMFPRGKLAALLASPADFRYAEMRGDREFLESLGWRVKWIEFEGGHRTAPAAVYEEAARWLEAELASRDKAQR